MDGEDFDLGPSNPFVSPAPASRVEEGGWAGPSNPFLGTNGDGPLSFTSNPGTPGSRGYYDDDDNDAISPASGSMMDRTRSSLIAEQDLLDLSDVDESDESDEDEAFLANSLAPRELVRWSAADDEEVEEISLRILSSLHGPVGELETVGSSTTSQAMAGERMNIFSHAKALSSNQDLLGLGTVDFRNAALIRDSGDENSDRPGKGRGQNIKGRGWSKSLDILPPRMSVLHSGAGPSTKEDSALFASSDAFDPKKYLGNVHKGSSLEDLRRGLSFLKKQLNEGKDQRMLLVKENFERFIKCKNTIDDIHAKLQHNELHSSSEAASTVLLMQSLSDVKDKSNSIFQPLIERQHERENLQSLLSTFRRYQWFLEMPTTLETHLNNRKNDQVVSCYKKSKIFMEENPNIKLFSKVFHEIERVIAGYKDKLYRNLEGCKVDVEKAKELISTLMRLQGNRIFDQNLHKENPFLVYLNSLSDYVIDKMNEHFADYESALEDLIQSQATNEEDRDKSQAKETESTASVEGILFNVVLFASGDGSVRQRPQAGPRLFLEYETDDSVEVATKLKIGRLQSAYAARLSSVLLTVLDVLLHIYLDEESMLKMLKSRKDVDATYLLDIVDQAEAKVHTVFEVYKNQIQMLFTSSENSTGLWVYMKEVTSATSTVLDEIEKRGLPQLDLTQITDLSASLTERFVKYVCAQLETACAIAGRDLVTRTIRARPVQEDRSASLSVLHVGDAMLVGLQKVVDSLTAGAAGDPSVSIRHQKLAESVEISMNKCFHSCASEFDRLGEETSAGRRNGSDHKSEIKRVLQGLQDAEFLENRIFPAIHTLLGALPRSQRRPRSHSTSPLIETMHILKKRYVDLNAARTQSLSRAYSKGSLEASLGGRTSPSEIGSHVFIVLHFFVEQHSHGWQAVPHLCKELLTLLVESFFETLSLGLHKKERKVTEEEYLQCYLEISYLERALGSYVSVRAHKNAEQIKRQLFSRCRTHVETSAIDGRLTQALDRTKLHWLCFH